MTQRTRIRFLLWAPVVLLPLSNLLSAILSGAAFDLRNVLPWVAGAVLEELFFRFFLLKKLLLDSARMKSIRAVALVSLLFAAMHLFNLRSDAEASAVLVQAACAFCFAVWAGAAVCGTGSVLIPLFAHVLLNATAFDAVLRIIPLAASALTLIDGIVLLSFTGGHTDSRDDLKHGEDKSQRCPKSD